MMNKPKEELPLYNLRIGQPKSALWIGLHKEPFGRPELAGHDHLGRSFSSDARDR